MAEEKSFKPSKQKLDQARKKGKTLKSQLLSQGIGSAVVLGVALVGARYFCLDSKILLHYWWQKALSEPQVALVQAMIFVVGITLPSLVIGSLASAGVQMLQSGLIWEPGLALPKFSRVDPVAGFIRLFSGLAQLWQFALRLVVAGLVFFLCLRSDVASMLGSLSLEAKSSGEVWAPASHLVVRGLVLLLAFGVLDYLIHRKRFYSELSMSHEELKREQRDQDGDPFLRMTRRAEHEMLMQQDIVARVRRAKVLVVERARQE